MAKARCVPGIAKWSVYAGGTSCPMGAHGYGYYGAAVGNYAVEPNCPQGRLRGYTARFENVMGRAKRSGLHQWLHADGSPGYVRGGTFRSPAAAAAAADKHCRLVEGGLAGAKRRRSRR